MVRMTHYSNSCKVLRVFEETSTRKEIYMVSCIYIFSILNRKLIAYLYHFIKLKTDQNENDMLTDQEQYQAKNIMESKAKQSQKVNKINASKFKQRVTIKCISESSIYLCYLVDFPCDRVLIQIIQLHQDFQLQGCQEINSNVIFNDINLKNLNAAPYIDLESAIIQIATKKLLFTQKLNYQTSNKILAVDSILFTKSKIMVYESDPTISLECFLQYFNKQNICSSVYIKQIKNMMQNLHGLHIVHMGWKQKQQLSFIQESSTAINYFNFNISQMAIQLCLSKHSYILGEKKAKSETIDAQFMNKDLQFVESLCDTYLNRSYNASKTCLTLISKKNIKIHQNLLLKIWNKQMTQNQIQNCKIVKLAEKFKTVLEKARILAASLSENITYPILSQYFKKNFKFKLQTLSEQQDAKMIKSEEKGKQRQYSQCFQKRNALRFQVISFLVKIYQIKHRNEDLILLYLDLFQHNTLQVLNPNKPQLIRQTMRFKLLEQYCLKFKRKLAQLQQVKQIHFPDKRNNNYKSSLLNKNTKVVSSFGNPIKKAQRRQQKDFINNLQDTHKNKNFENIFLGLKNQKLISQQIKRYQRKQCYCKIGWQQILINQLFNSSNDTERLKQIKKYVKRLKKYEKCYSCRIRLHFYRAQIFQNGFKYNRSIKEIESALALCQIIQLLNSQQREYEKSSENKCFLRGLYDEVPIQQIKIALLNKLSILNAKMRQPEKAMTNWKQCLRLIQHSKGMYNLQSIPILYNILATLIKQIHKEDLITNSQIQAYHKLLIQTKRINSPYLYNFQKSNQRNHFQMKRIDYLLKRFNVIAIYSSYESANPSVLGLRTLEKQLQNQIRDYIYTKYKANAQKQQSSQESIRPIRNQCSSQNQVLKCSNPMFKHFQTFFAQSQYSIKARSQKLKLKSEAFVNKIEQIFGKDKVKILNSIKCRQPNREFYDLYLFSQEQLLLRLAYLSFRVTSKLLFTNQNENQLQNQICLFLIMLEQLKRTNSLSSNIFSYLIFILLKNSGQLVKATQILNLLASFYKKFHIMQKKFQESKEKDTQYKIFYRRQQASLDLRKYEKIMRHIISLSLEIRVKMIKNCNSKFLLKQEDSLLEYNGLQYYSKQFSSLSRIQWQGTITQVKRYIEYLYLIENYSECYSILNAYLKHQRQKSSNSVKQIRNYSNRLKLKSQQQNNETCNSLLQWVQKESEQFIQSIGVCLAIFSQYSQALLFLNHPKLKQSQQQSEIAIKYRIICNYNLNDYWEALCDFKKLLQLYPQFYRDQQISLISIKLCTNVVKKNQEQILNDQTIKNALIICYKNVRQNGVSILNIENQNLQLLLKQSLQFESQLKLIKLEIVNIQRQIKQNNQNEDENTKNSMSSYYDKKLYQLNAMLLILTLQKNPQSNWLPQFQYLAGAKKVYLNYFTIKNILKYLKIIVAQKDKPSIQNALIAFLKIVHKQYGENIQLMQQIVEIIVSCYQKKQLIVKLILILQIMKYRQILSRRNFLLNKDQIQKENYISQVEQIFEKIVQAEQIIAQRAVFGTSERYQQISVHQQNLSIKKFQQDFMYLQSGPNLLRDILNIKWLCKNIFSLFFTIKKVENCQHSQINWDHILQLKEQLLQKIQALKLSLEIQNPKLSEKINKKFEKMYKFLQSI